MDLKISNNLFLGLQEITQLKNSLRSEGYEKIFKQMISDYGVVRGYENDAFTGLQVVDSGLGQLTVKAGLAIDSSLNIVDVKTDLADVLSVPSDGIARYVVIKHLSTVIETGTVDIAVDGSLVGTDTEFVSRLRGLPNFPSKIKFPNSTQNTQEYIVQAVQNDTLASLNVAASSVQAESAQEYVVIGTFSPGINVPSANKEPFINDGYTIELRSSDTVIEGEEFLLATVVNTLGTVAISDTRANNIFNFLTEDINAINSVGLVNEVISIVESKFKYTTGSTDTSVAKIEWGIRSSAWNLNEGTRQLEVFSGSGGTWADLTPFAPGDFVGQYVIFEDGVGQAVKILSSNLILGDVVLELESQASYVQGGDIVIAPLGLMELKISHDTKNFFHQSLTAAFTGHALVELPPGTWNVEYRMIQNNKSSNFRVINDNTYLTEASFNTNGFINTGSEFYENSVGGDIIIASDTANTFLTLLGAVVFPGVIWDYVGAPGNIPAGWVICNGQPITDPGGIFDGTDAPNLNGRVMVGFDSGDIDYSTVGNQGGEKKHTLVAGEESAHSHTATFAGTAHSHPIRFRQGAHIDQSVNPGGNGEGSRKTMVDVTALANSEETTAGGTVTVNVSAAATAHENRQPYHVAYKIMKL